jgi:hypothetical protein
MSQFNTITEFNTYLADNQRRLSISEYFKELHNKFYKEIDISFMEYFLLITRQKHEFIVDHIKLKEYGVLNNIKTSNKIQRALEQYNLIENEHYQVSNVGQSRLDGQHGGSNGNKKEYKLTPVAFKICLIRAKNSLKYAMYYLLLEECHDYYNEYQMMYQNVLLSGKDVKIDELKNKLNKQSEEIAKLINYSKEANTKLDNANEKIDDLQIQNDEIIDVMHDMKDALYETSDNYVPLPNNDNERHEFILLQHKDLTNTFKFIRGIQKYNENKIKNKYSEYNIIKREFNANPIQFFKIFKEEIKEEYDTLKAKITQNKSLKNKVQLKREIEKIKFKGNTLTLQYNYSLNDFLDKLTEINNKRFELYEEFNDCP